MGKLRPIEIHRLIYPSLKELNGIILDKEFMSELLQFKIKSPIPDGVCFQLCWKMEDLLRELKHRHPDLSYICVYFSLEYGDEYVYEGDLSSALEIVICYKPSFSFFQSALQ